VASTQLIREICPSIHLFGIDRAYYHQSSDVSFDVFNVILPLHSHTMTHCTLCQVLGHAPPIGISRTSIAATRPILLSYIHTRYSEASKTELRSKLLTDPNKTSRSYQLTEQRCNYICDLALTLV
jgi:hypothetical protein